jgi:hypothetical protein
MKGSNFIWFDAIEGEDGLASTQVKSGESTRRRNANDLA